MHSRAVWALLVLALATTGLALVPPAHAEPPDRPTSAAPVPDAPSAVVAPAPGGTPLPTALPDVSVPMSTVRDVAVDPVTGRLFVAGDDEVVAFAPDGTLLGVVAAIPGAYALTFAGSAVWVSESSTGAIAQIDIASLSVSHTYPAGGVTVGGVVAVAGSVWFVRRVDAVAPWTMAVMAQATGAVADRGGQFAGPVLRPLPASSDVLLGTVAGPGWHQLAKVNIAANPVIVGVPLPVQTYEDRVPSNYAISEDGAYLWFGGTEYRMSDLTSTGRTVPGYSSVAYTAQAGGVTVGGEGTSIQVTLRDRPRVARQMTGPASSWYPSVAVAPDASRAYVVSPQGSTVLVRSFTMAPSVAATSPASFVTGRGGELTITGDGLGLFTHATIDGVAIGRSLYSPGQLRLEVPRTLTVGAHPLVLSGPLGTTPLTVTVVANEGATVQGSVSHNGVLLPAVQVTLSGAGLAGPVTTTTDASGHYALAAIPTSPSRAEATIVAHDPTSSFPDTRRRDLFLEPNVVTTVDLPFDSAAPTDPTIARQPVRPRGVDLPDAQRGAVVQEGSGGRVFVSTGDEVDVFDRAGVRIGRIDDLWGADGLALDGTSLYVNLAASAEVVRVQTGSLAVTGRWPIGFATDGTLAVAANRVWFSNGASQWTTLASLDPTSGVVQTHPNASTASMYWTPKLYPVAGHPTQLLVAEGNGGARVLDVGTFPPPVQLGGSPLYDVGDAVTFANPARVLIASGWELSLPDLNASPATPRFTPPSGIYGSWEGVASADVPGGVVQLGPWIFLDSSASLSQYLTDCGTRHDGQAIDPSGDRTFTMCGDTFVVSDLRPRAQVVEPQEIYAAPTDVTVVGDALAGATAVTCDGGPVPFTVVDTNHISVSLPTVSPGAHQLVVTTPLGTSLPVDVLARDRPAVTSVSPSSGPVVGGTTVTIKGTHLSRVLLAHFGADDVGVQVVDDSTITATTPSMPAGPVPVTVSTSVGPGTGSASYTFVAPVPVIDGADQKRGPVSGGYDVAFFGSGLAFPTAATVDGVAAVVHPESDGRVRITMPPHAAGVVPVTVTTAGGTSVASPNATFTYSTAPPKITSLRPAEGPATGSTFVTVQGSDLWGATSLTVASTSIPFTATSDTQLWVALPPHAPGSVDVVVTTANGSSTPDPASTFRYFSPGVVPAAPTAVVATPKRQGALISWSAPPTTTAESPKGYTATASPGGATCTVNLAFDAPLSCSLAGLSPGTAYTVTVTAANTAGTGPASAPSAPVVPIGGSYFHPLAPLRLLDSRGPVGSWSGPLVAGAPRTLLVTPDGSGIPANAEAVVVNITVTGSTDNSFLTAYPAGGALPTASNLNFAVGQTVPNLATVKVGDGGQIALATASGSVQVIVDVVGYYSADVGDRFTPLAPVRLLDSRGATGGWPGPLVESAPRALPVRGVAGVPATASAVIVNVTATGGSANSFLTAYPSGSAPPTASNLNFAVGETVPNLVTVKIGADGSIMFNNAVGSVHVVVDLVGFYDATTGDVFHVLAPTRVLDSRGAVGGWAAPLVAGTPRALAFGTTTPPGATAVIGNATVTHPTANSFLTVYPGGPVVPAASNLNFGASQTVPNLVAVKLGAGGQITFANAVGSTDVIFDLVGYFQSW